MSNTNEEVWYDTACLEPGAQVELFGQAAWSELSMGTFSNTQEVLLTRMSISIVSSDDQFLADYVTATLRSEDGSKLMSSNRNGEHVAIDPGRKITVSAVADPAMPLESVTVRVDLHGEKLSMR